ncbi:MAG: lactate utilization protein [bacterium]|nr:lactate utilization protein [bacterium]
MSTARDAVFASIRKNLAGVQSAETPLDRGTAATRLGAPQGLDERAARVERFTKVLTSVDGRVHRVANEAEASEVLRAIAAEHGARLVALSDAPQVQRIAGALADLETFDGSRDRARLLECDLGVTGAQHGIAETGTLVLFSESERHRLTSLVPPIHVALVRSSTIVPTLGEALAEARRAGLPPLVSFITGPSRTGDIELTIVVGVHGPKTLHVILIDDD